MILEELHTLALDFNQIKYDPRLDIAMSEEQFEAYKINSGHTYYLYLYNLIRILKPINVVELGTSIGRSGLFMMCVLSENSKFTTIEKSSYMRVDLQPFFEDPRLNIIYGDDIDESVYKSLNLRDVDFMFIDTDHNIEQLEKEWEVYHKFLISGAIVVLDDISLNDGMKKFWNALNYEKISCPSSVHFSGFGIFKYA